MAVERRACLDTLSMKCRALSGTTGAAEVMAILRHWMASTTHQGNLRAGTAKPDVIRALSCLRRTAG